MENTPLPPELEQLECLLARGPRPVPSAALRRRVLAGVRSELRREHLLYREPLLHRESGWSKWRVAAALAATLLVGLGLWLGVVEATAFALQQPASPPTVYEVARRLQQLSPQLSQEGSLRQAMVRNIGAEAGCGMPLDSMLEKGDKSNYGRPSSEKRG